MNPYTAAAVDTTDAGTPSSRVFWLQRILPVISMLVFTLIGAVLPALGNHGFYFWDDTAAAAAGVWQRIAHSILNGQLPVLQLDMWRGGNLAAEAATGMWNPVMVALMVAVYPIDDIAMAMTVAKIALFLLTAAGVYLLARGYGASTWLAAAAGTALSLSGWVLYLDGTAWINGTAATAFLPWAWWATRRALTSEFAGGSLLTAAVCGYLSASTGNPYAALALLIVYAAVAIEALATKRPRMVPWLVGLGLVTMLLFAIAYLPFLYTSPYGVRSGGGVSNDEFLAVSLSDLLGLSSPTHHPYIAMWGAAMGLPGTYLAWFVLPLVPWLRWSVVRERWRELSSLFVFGSIYLLLVLGPSQVWLFRWPARLVPYLYCSVIVLFVALASAGLASDRRGARSTISGALVLIGAWLAFSDVPRAYLWHGGAALAVAAGVAAIVFWARDDARRFLVMATGMVLFIVPQLALQPFNGNVSDYKVPTSRSFLRAQFAHRTDGVVVQVFDVNALLAGHEPGHAWQDLLIGNMPSVAGLNSTTSYSGIGFTKFDSALCLTYNGAACAQAWDALWAVPKGATQSLADLIRARYVVVLNGYVKIDAVPAGWAKTETTDVVTIFERQADTVNPDGTVSFSGADVRLSSDNRVGPVDEAARVTTGQGDTTLTFARIAWPGYSLKVNGQTVKTKIGPAGLLTAELPAGLTDASMELSYRPPGLRLGLACAAAGLALLLGMVVLSARRRRRSLAIDLPQLEQTDPASTQADG